MSKLYDPNKRGKIVFELGVDFSKEQYDLWRAQLGLWISQSQRNESEPSKKAEHILMCAISGTRLNQQHWEGCESYSLKSRIKQLSAGFDITTGTGRSPVSMHGRNKKKEKAKSKDTIRDNKVIYVEQSLEQMIYSREAYKHLLFQEFPFLDNPVYETKVNALCDAVVKLEDISERFLLAGANKELEDLLKIRDGLKKDIDDFMKMLRIHPSQIKDKVDEFERGDIAGLINEWDSYGEVAEIYEQVDAIQELVQILRQLENKKVDGSPQLEDYLLWHKTGYRKTTFTCEHGTTYDLYNGYTKEELYEIAEAAYDAFGFGLKAIENEKISEVIEQAKEP